MSIEGFNELPVIQTVLSLPHFWGQTIVPPIITYTQSVAKLFVDTHLTGLPAKHKDGVSRDLLTDLTP